MSEPVRALVRQLLACLGNLDMDLSPGKGVTASGCGAQRLIVSLQRLAPALLDAEAIASTPREVRLIEGSVQLQRFCCCGVCRLTRRRLLRREELYPRIS